MHMKKLVSRSLHWRRKRQEERMSSFGEQEPVASKVALEQASSGREREKKQKTSHLDQLPAELKVIILRHCPDITTLKALTLSSPSYHVAYLEQRRLILSNVLHNALPPSLFFEAYSVFEAKRFQQDEGSISRVSEIKSFLLDYHEARKSGNFPSAPLDLEALLPMAQFNIKVEAIVKHYYQPILTTNPVSKEPQPSDGAISRTELSRLYRGLYRFELFCLMFGERKYDLEVDDDWGIWARGFSVLTISRLFLSKLAAWEVEEVVCIGKYILDTYDRILGDCSDLDPEQQKREYQKQRLKSGMLALHRRSVYLAFVRLLTSIEIASIYKVRLNEKKEYSMSRGLRLFHKVITSHSPATQTKILTELSGDEDSFLARALDKYHESQQRSQRQHIFGREDRGEFVFMGEEEGPNAGFVWSRAGSPWGVEHVDIELRGWGYVFWDEKRLTDWGVLKSVPRMERAC
jgi:hypothetical protein